VGENKKKQSGICELEKEEALGKFSAFERAANFIPPRCK